MSASISRNHQAGSQSRKWYGFTVPPQKEYVAAHILQSRFGAETFIPTKTRWRKRNKHCKQKEEFAFPIIPGCLFAGFSGVVPWYDLYRVRMVTGFIGIRDEPTLLNRTPKLANRFFRFMASQVNGHLQVEGTKRRAVAEASTVPPEQRFMLSGREYRAGDDVQVLEGAFRERIVKVKEIRGANAVILQQLFGIDMEVEIPLWQLEPAA